MDMRGYENYRKQSVTDMTPGELLMLLYDELVKRTLRAEMELKNEQYPQFEASLERAVEILDYLDETLDHQYPISQELHRLYDFFCYELRRSKIGRNMEVLVQVKPMILDLRDTFREANKNSAER